MAITMTKPTVDRELILEKLYDTAKDYQFFKRTQKSKAEKLKRQLNILKAECQQLGVKYDLTTILK